MPKNEKKRERESKASIRERMQRRTAAFSLRRDVHDEDDEECIRSSPRESDGGSRLPYKNCRAACTS